MTDEELLELLESGVKTSKSRDYSDYSDNNGED